jgi:hypothetical protein
LSKLFRFFVGANLGGLWIEFIGWCLLDASRSSYVQVELTQALHDRKGSNIMGRDCPTVESHVNLQHFVHEYLLRTGRHCYVVIQNHPLVGLIRPIEIRRFDRPVAASQRAECDAAAERNSGGLA